jgi:beta-lactam-binding protein with PASTA domain
VSYARQTLTIFKRILIVIGIAIAFALGLLGAIYLSLRSSETRVPDIVGKDRAAAETTISDSGLNFRVRATRPTSEAKPDTVLIQLPHAGEIVKVGQTVAVDISRPSLNGESSVPNSDSNTNSNTNNSATNTNSKSDNSNVSENANDKPKKKPTPNKNANANANANNRNANANRPPANTNANRVVTPPAGNVNAPAGNANRPPRNVNTERRPVPPAPTPLGR